MDKQFIEQQRAKLLEKKKDIEQSLVSHSKQDPHDASNFAPLFPDYGSKEEDNAEEVVQFEQNIALEERFEESIKLINAALERIEQGTYGTCTVTGKPIPKERLTVMPEAATIAEV